MNRLLIPALCLLPLILSCTANPKKKALQELDETMGRREEYRRDFERRNDELRDCLDKAGTDSLRWESAWQLFDAYHHFSADSAGHYITLMKGYASDEVQRKRTSIAQSYLLGTAHYEERALDLFQAIDTTGLQSMGLTEAYLEAGIKIYTNLSRFSRPLQEDRNYSDSLQACRNAYLALDTLSYEGRKLLAQRLRDEGHPRQALEIFQACLGQTPPDDYHRLTSIAYNMANLYGQLGDNGNKITWLARSAIADFRAPNRDFLSLNELALMLYQEGDYTRASHYINVHFEDVYAGGFQAQVIRSSDAQNMIAEAALKAQRQKHMVLVAAVGILSLLLLVIFYLMLLRRRQAEKLRRANAALEQANTELSNANKIKDNYVFRYMDLSVRYLDRIEETRHHLRQIARNQGTDALLKELRSAADYADYKEFYRIFDQTFLGIFPGFVKDVNALLRENARFEVPAGSPLPTEIRILAAIRLGIDDSPSIASFLKCSLSTVYTYRAKMRNQALCPKDEFEPRVKALA